jgi:phage host-nuclease inhibitor protein Gam
MAEEEAEITRYRKALAAEIQRILSRYGTLTTPHEKRRTQAQSLVEECALRAQFVGKAKSRKVGNGVYGQRQVPESVTITDEEKARVWLFEQGSRAFRTKVEIDKVIAKELVLEKLKATGEIPDGFSHESAHDVPFAKALPLETIK